MSGEIDYNRAIFYSEVWSALSEIEDQLVIKTFIEQMKKINESYEMDGGIYPTVEYVIGLAKDIIKRNISETDNNKNLMKEKVRESWNKRFREN